ncbi:hypothetical protein ACFL5O_06760 [Myxococcota bacterium]
MEAHWWTRVILGVVVVGACSCGSASRAGVEPRRAYDSASEIQTRAAKAQADLKECQSDRRKCAQVEHALASIVRSSRALGNAALEAGYQPDVSSPTPVAP